jgi:hypothetical protein
MDAKKMPQAFKLLTCAALIATLAAKAVAQTIDSDSPSSLAIENQIAGNGKFEANLATQDNPGQGLSDFAIEFHFRTPNPANSRFDLKIEGDGTDAALPHDPILNLSYDVRTGWGAYITANGTTVWQPISGMKPVSPDAWYRFRFVGRDWGAANAYYNLQLSDPDKAGFTSAATNLTWFENPDSTGQLARHLTLVNTAAGDAKLDINGLKVTVITPYKGPVVTGVNTRTLFGKVMCGYQGWFSAPGDGGLEHGWRHWTKHGGPLADGNAKVDLWPDVSELDASQRFPTGFKMPDGSPAEVFSSFEKPTVLKHFEWMQEYGIDGVFVQRFANGLKSPVSLEHCNTVLANCREGANLHGRAYAVMYDLSGLHAGQIDNVINDWRALRNKMVITEDPAYLHHNGKPVVAIWGIGFNDHRDYTLADCRRLIEFLKNDPEAGGCTVMLGVPTHWRELADDAVSDPELLKVIALADIVSPWTVGRYADPAGADRYAQKTLKPDLAWCRERDLDYMPVVFPGFSWHNMYGAPSGQIPRRRGQFLWSQFRDAKNANVSMLYVAMFDEVDEGTAIFKCVNNVPVGEQSKFVTFEGLPSDFYLKMVGAGTKLIHDEALSDGALHTQANLE